ncbi:MAG: hypothetical protein LUQ50_15645 [Methanospirillum sp.]|uniref:hypothetical protein n=1 Tax=Methanospirillum sp. TaxID=45200 RepID=UPI002370D2F8|nr:hypothetical protein [Methanospirillum sp.]MDD1730488.1 hypothetical protein [Methanospirillum sp.]
MIEGSCNFCKELELHPGTINGRLAKPTHATCKLTGIQMPLRGILFLHEGACPK